MRVSSTLGALAFWDIFTLWLWVEKSAHRQDDLGAGDNQLLLLLARVVGVRGQQHVGQEVRVGVEGIGIGALVEVDLVLILVGLHGLVDLLEAVLVLGL